MIHDREQDDRRFAAALQGVDLDKAGRSGGGLRSFHERMKARLGLNKRRR